MLGHGDKQHILNESSVVTASLISKPTLTLAEDTGVASDGITSNGVLQMSELADGVSRSYTVDGVDLGADYGEPTQDGDHVVVITDTDTAGNTATKRLAYTLDTFIAQTTVVLRNDTADTTDTITSDGRLTLSTQAPDVTRKFNVSFGGIEIERGGSMHGTLSPSKSEPLSPLVMKSVEAILIDGSAQV